MPPNDPRALLAVLAQLENIRDPSRIAGLRQFARYIVRGDAELHPLGQGEINRAPIAIQLRDVSWTGIGFICNQRLNNNALFRLHMLNHGHSVGQQSMMVRHCREIRDNLYLVGGQFCIEAGMLSLLGLNPGALSQGDAATEHFVPPSEVA